MTTNHFDNCKTKAEYKQAIRVYLIANYSDIELLCEILSADNPIIANDYIGFLVKILASYVDDRNIDLRRIKTWQNAISLLNDIEYKALINNKLRSLRDAFIQQITRHLKHFKPLNHSWYSIKINSVHDKAHRTAFYYLTGDIVGNEYQWLSCPIKSSLKVETMIEPITQITGNTLSKLATLNSVYRVLFLDKMQLSLSDCMVFESNRQHLKDDLKSFVVTDVTNDCLFFTSWLVLHTLQGITVYRRGSINSTEYIIFDSETKEIIEYSDNISENILIQMNEYNARFNN